MTTTNKFGPLGVAHLCGELKVIQEPAAQHVATMTDRPDADEYARLFSAAPELLEVAQSILADDLLQYLPAEYVAKVRAVIAKATGEQS